MLIAPQKTDFQEQKREIDRSSASGRLLPVTADCFGSVPAARDWQLARPDSDQSQKLVDKYTLTTLHIFQVHVGWKIAKRFTPVVTQAT